MKTEIQFIPPYCAQGDLNIFSCKNIPEGLVEQKKENDQYILAHSETGHHHIVDANTVRVVNENDFISFMEVKKESKVIHLRDFDTHKTIVLPPGNYRLTKQREHVLEKSSELLEQQEAYRRAMD